MPEPELQTAKEIPQQHYAAFISYRHLSPDKEVAQALHRMLEHNRTRPNRQVKAAIRPVFLDTGELPTLENIDEGICNALRNSDCLFVICSPNLPLSRYCMREISYFKELHGGRLDRIYTVLVDGEPAEAFPEILRYETVPGSNGETSTREIESLFADVRAPTIRQSIRKLRKTEYLRLAAAYFHCTYDSLYQRHRRRLRRLILTSVSAVLVGAALFGAYVWHRNMQDSAERAATCATYMEGCNEEGNELLSITLSQESWDSAVASGSSRFMTALRSAAVQYDYRLQVPPVAPLFTATYENGFSPVFYNKSDADVIFSLSEHVQQLTDAKTGSILMQEPEDSVFIDHLHQEYYVTIAAVPDSNNILWDTWSLWRVADHQLLGSHAFRQSTRKTPQYSLVSVVDVDDVLIITDADEPVAYLSTDGEMLTKEEARRRLLTAQEEPEEEDPPFQLIKGNTIKKTFPRIVNRQGEAVFTLSTAPSIYAFSPDWAYFGYVEDQELHIMETSTWSPAGQASLRDGILNELFLLNNSHYAVCCYRSSDSWWDADVLDWRNGTLLTSLDGYIHTAGSGSTFYAATPNSWTRYAYHDRTQEDLEICAMHGSVCLARDSRQLCLLTCDGKQSFTTPCTPDVLVQWSADLSRFLIQNGSSVTCLDASGHALWTQQSEGPSAISESGKLAAVSDADGGIRVLDASSGSELYVLPAEQTASAGILSSLSLSSDGICVAGFKKALFFPVKGSAVELGPYDQIRLHENGILLLESSSAYILDAEIRNIKTGEVLFTPTDNTGLCVYSPVSGYFVRQVETSGNHPTRNLEVWNDQHGTMVRKAVLLLPGLDVTDLALDSTGEYLSLTAGGISRVYSLRDMTQLLSVLGCTLRYEDGHFRDTAFRNGQLYSVPCLMSDSLKEWALSYITGISGVRQLRQEERARFAYTD